MNYASNNADAFAIDIRNVSFSYGNSVEALAGLNLEIRRGSAVGIIGPSGCGKSTLLSLIAGLNAPSSGEVAVTHADPSRQCLSMMFQKDTLLPWLTTRDNIKLFGKFHKGQRAAIAGRVDELVRLAALEGFEKAYPYQLSGGMRRRAALLSAVAPMPETLLLDEPFSSLDEPTRLSIHQDFLHISRRFDMTVVLVTHDLAEAISLCDEIVILGRRPGSVVSRHSVPFGSARNVLELRQTPAYLELYGTLWHELSEQIKRSQIVSASA